MRPSCYLCLLLATLVLAAAPSAQVTLASTEGLLLGSGDVPLRALKALVAQSGADQTWDTTGLTLVEETGAVAQSRGPSGPAPAWRR